MPASPRSVRSRCAAARCSASIRRWSIPALRFRPSSRHSPASPIACSREHPRSRLLWRASGSSRAAPCSWHTTRPMTCRSCAGRARRPTCRGPGRASSTPHALHAAPSRATRCATASLRPSRASSNRPLPRATAHSMTREPRWPSSTASWSGWAHSACSAWKTSSPSGAARRRSSAPSVTSPMPSPRLPASTSSATRRVMRSTSARRATCAPACAPTSPRPSSASACPRWWASPIASIRSCARPTSRPACASCASSSSTSRPTTGARAIPSVRCGSHSPVSLIRAW